MFIYFFIWRSGKESERMDAFGVQINKRPTDGVFFSPRPSRVPFTSGKVRAWRRLPAVTSCDDKTTHSAPPPFKLFIISKQYSANVRFSRAPSGRADVSLLAVAHVTHLVSLGKDSLTLSSFLVFALRGGERYFWGRERSSRSCRSHLAPARH